MKEKDPNEPKADFPVKPLSWLAQVSRLSWIEIIIEIGKFKQASRRAHLIALVVGIVILLLMGYSATYV